MGRSFLPHEFIPSFLEILAGLGEVHGPVMTGDGVAALRHLDEPGKLRLDCRRTLIPPKKYLLPPRETCLTWTPEKFYEVTGAAPGRIILVGIPACDLHGITYLDRVFLAEPPDPLYSARRNLLTLVAVSCEPDDACFCGDVGSCRPVGFDLFMGQDEEGFFLTVGSARGEEIMQCIDHLLIERKSPPPLPTHPELERMKLACVAGETFEKSPLWGEFASRCLSCGACSHCCPTCYCFDVREYGLLDGRRSERAREWDNCLFKAHGEVSGGGSFRRSREERLRYRFQHKYLGFGPLRGVVSCVGCGRCREVCPVGIDLAALFREGNHEQP